MKTLLAVTRALSDVSRVRAFMALEAGELCVCQIIALLGLAPSTVSKHMAILREAGLVAARKEGRWIYYRVAGPDDGGHVEAALDFARRMLRRDETVSADRERLDQVLAMDKEALCRDLKTN